MMLKKGGNGQDGTYARAGAAYVAARIHAEGWHPIDRSIGTYASKFRAPKGLCLMEAVRAILGRSVVAWELEPDRTEGDVLAILDRVAAGYDLGSK